MSQWVPAIPPDDGWYWIAYQGKNGEVVCPCEVHHLRSAAFVRTARGDSFTSRTREFDGFADAEFGPKIETPRA